MKTRLLLATTLFALAAFLPVRTVIDYSPEEGSEIYRSFEVTASFGLEEVSMRMNDQEFPMGMGGVDPTDIEGEFGYALQVRDRFVGVADRRPTKIHRTYETVTFSHDAFDDSGEESVDEIEGQDVVFTWNEEEGGYDREWGEDSEGDEDEALAVLAEDLDLRALLPGEDVEAGDRWEVPATKLGSFIIPGLDFTRAAESEIEGFDGIPVGFADPLREALEEAVLECTFKGMRADGDVALAFIGLALSTEISMDVADVVAAQIAEQADFEGDVDEFAIDLFLDFEGELLWDVKRGHFHTFELTGDVALDLYASAEVDFGEAQIPMELEAELTGELSIEGTTVE